MINLSSPLLRLPGHMDRREAIILDGIRHCGQFVSFAYGRLQQVLTELALGSYTDSENEHRFTCALIDAWSIVDTVDRFRCLWNTLPNDGGAALDEGDRPFAEVAESIQNLRNVGDHIAQRLDFVVAHNGTALGSLKWFTITQKEPMKGIICAILAGTMQRDVSSNMVNPLGKTIEYPTGLIELSAGRYDGSLSEVIPEMERRIKKLEQVIGPQIEGTTGAGADFLIKAFFEAR